MNEIVEKVVTAKSYTLRKEDGSWLGQIIITNDGAYTSITDYGNFNFAWRSYGGEGKDFREFLIGLGVDYFATKMYGGMTYIAYGKKIEKAAQLYAEMVLPILQKALKEELETERNNKK